LIQKSTIQFLDHQQTEKRNVKRCITKGVYWGGEKFWGYVNSTHKTLNLLHCNIHNHIKIKCLDQMQALLMQNIVKDHHGVCLQNTAALEEKRSCFAFALL
jgi:hypothetical protein